MFTLDTIPFGIYTIGASPKRVATRVGNTIIDLYELSQAGHLDTVGIKSSIFQSSFLNPLMAEGKEKTNTLRLVLQDLLVDLQNISEQAKHNIEDVQLHMPVQVGDYTDFYSSEQHAYNVGCMFRDPQNALLPNWKHLPVAYHGRASSIFVSGQNFHRPKGQTCADESQPPVFGPTKRLDFELEMATVIGKSTELGESIDVNKAEEYVFGFLLFNDWSARDIQKWEYVPLGPFLAKNFFSSVSPWVVTIEALNDFRVPAGIQNPPVLPYLHDDMRLNFDVKLEVYLKNSAGSEIQICDSNFKHMYWTVAQQLAHHTVNGCNINVGDLLASGTISGKEPNSYGSLLELTWSGKNAIVLPDGSKRTFVEDGDTVTIKAYADNGYKRVDFGEVANTVLSVK